MLVKSINLIATSGLLYNVKITGATLGTPALNITRATGTGITGIPSIQIDSKWSLAISDATGTPLIYLQNLEYLMSPQSGPIWFVGDDNKPYQLMMVVNSADPQYDPVSGLQLASYALAQVAYTPQSGTPFFIIYNRFLSKITDDMYLEWTLDDTYKNLESILLDVIPQFEWPKFGLYNYNSQAIGMIDQYGSVVSYGKYLTNLTLEEIDIFASLMAIEWLSRQILTVNLTRMKYSTSDFKLTSQANHMNILLKVKEQFEVANKKIQRLYKRRTLDAYGRVTANYGGLGSSAIIERWRLLRLGAEWLYGSPFNGGTWWNEELNNMYGVYFGGILPGVPSGIMPYESTDTIFPQGPVPTSPPSS
jgi:hypothetical protein